MKRTGLFVIGAVLLVACQDSQIPVDVGQPSFAVSDGAHEIDGQLGNEHFFFLPPIVPTPTTTGVFNANLRPRVNVWGGFPDEVRPECTSHERLGAVVHFEGDDVSVDPDGETYSVGWQTGDPPLESEQIYRICVWSHSVDDGGNLVFELLGFRDVKPEDSNDDNRSTAQTPIYEFKNGSNLPIKFIIEKGALCDDDIGDCTAAVFDATGGSAICADETCAIDVPPGAIPDATGETLFFVQQVVCNELVAGDPENPRFLPTLDLPQFPGCLVVSTPGGEITLDEEIVVAACIQADHPALDKLRVGGTGTGSLIEGLFRRLQLHHLLANGSIEALPNTFSPIDLSCEGDLQTVANGSGGLLQYAAAAFKALQRTLLPWTDPKPAFAINRGFGGSTGTLSPFVWAMPAQMEKYDWVNPELVTAGEAKSVKVKVTNNLSDDCEGAVPETCIDLPGNEVAVEGATVRWEVTLGDGTVAPASTLTGPNGIALVSWTIGLLPGPQTLDAYGLGLGLAESEGGDGPFAQHFFTGDPGDAIETLDSPRLTFEALACPAGATVDGAIEEDEYAHSAPFMAQLSGGEVGATVYWTNDCDNLYLGVEVQSTDIGDNVSLRFVFDNDGDGMPEVNDDILFLRRVVAKRTKVITWEFEDRFLTEDCLGSKQSDCGALDNTQDGSGIFASNGTHGVYEMVHPLSSGDVQDFDLAISGNPAECTNCRAGFFLVLQLGNGAKGNTEWPDFRVYQEIVISF